MIGAVSPLTFKVIIFFFKKGGTSLAVQWLRLHASTAGGKGSIPGRRTKIPHTAWHSQKTDKKIIVHWYVVIAILLILFGLFCEVFLFFFVFFGFFFFWFLSSFALLPCDLMAIFSVVCGFLPLFSVCICYRFLVCG